MKLAGLLSISLMLVFMSCRKNQLITSSDARIYLSDDTLHFDTVFTTTGSVTQYFILRNENNQKLRISSIELMGGAASSFHINADGITGPVIRDIELEARDSVYVFVNVSINQSTANLPFIIRDSVRVRYNGNERFVQLEAWGQNAHFFRNKVIDSDQTWTNDLPYVILGSLQVRPGQTLTMEKGCRIFLHADAPVIVEGSLRVNGERDSADRVYFQGDRLDIPYNEFPAAWPGIYFTATSQDNQFHYAVIRNAYQALAVQDPSTNGNPKLLLNESVVTNAYDAGLISLNSSISARNCLISNCGKNLVLVQGGNYQFDHCTIVSYSNAYITHKDPVMLLTNFVSVNNNPVTADLNAAFRNCIFWGENGLVDDEVVVARSGNSPFSVSFDHVLWKLTNTPANSTISQAINNQAPQFDSINISRRYYDFRLRTGSPAIDAGIISPVTSDLDGFPRPVGPPDLGCYEKQ